VIIKNVFGVSLHVFRLLEFGTAVLRITKIPNSRSHNMTIIDIVTTCISSHPQEKSTHSYCKLYAQSVLVDEHYIVW